MINGKRKIGHTLLGAIVFALAAMFYVATASAAKITVTHWGAQFYGAPYAVAMAKGYFKDAGVDIDGFYTSTGGGTSVRNTLASDLPYGEVSLAAAVEAVNAGFDLVIVSQNVDTVADLLWVTKPGSPYHSIKDLKGKKIGYSRPGSVTNMLILMALKSAGMSPDDVDLVATGGSGSTLTAVLQGAVAAGWFAEPLWTKDKGEVKPVFWVKDVMSPDMVQTVGITTRKFAKKHPDKIRAIIAARRKGVEFIYKHPDEAAEITAKAYDSDNVDLYKSVFHHFKKIHYWNQGAFNYDALNRMVQGLKIVGKLKGNVDWSKIIDQSFLPKDLQHQNAGQ